MNNNYSLTNEYSERYEKLMASLSEAKADAGLSPEEKAKKRDERKFGKSWEAEGGKPSSTEMRRATHASKRREATGKETPEDQAKRAKAVAERQAAGQSKSGTQVQKLTGHQRGGKKRSIKAKLAKGPSKPLPIPDHHQNYFDLLNSLLEGKAERMIRSGNPDKRMKGLVKSGKEMTKRALRGGMNPEIARTSYSSKVSPEERVEASREIGRASAEKMFSGRLAAAGIKPPAKKREDSSNRTYNDLLSSLLGEAGKAGAHWQAGDTPDKDTIIVKKIGDRGPGDIKKTIPIPASNKKKFEAAKKAFPTLSRGSSSSTEAGGAFAGSARRPRPTSS